MKCQVLVVDDHLTYSSIVTSAALARGFQVLEPVDTTADAVAACQTHRPEVVVLDLHLSGDVDGLALCELILDIDADVRVIGASSFDDNELMERAFRHGVSRCLRKPFHLDEALRLFDHLARELTEIPV